MPRFVLHVGYPKTGTTFLQQSVFAQLDAVLNLGRPLDMYNADTLGLRRGILVDPAPDLDAIAETMRTDVRQRAADGDRRVAVLSDEHFSTAALTSTMATQPPETVFARLRATFPDARVLFVLRRQADLVRSQHTNELRVARTRRGLAAWLAEERARADGGVFRAFDFERTAEVAASHFGADRLHVLLYEDLVHAPDRFAHDLAAALDVPPDLVKPYIASTPLNRSSGLEDVYLTLRRWVPPAALRAGPLRHLRRGAILPRVRRIAARLPVMGAARRLDPAVEAEIQHHFAPGNTRLAVRFGLPLAAYGYPVESQHRGSVT